MAVAASSVRGFQNNSKLNELMRTAPNSFSSVLNTINALVMVMDQEGRIIRFNRACEMTSGYTLEEARGKCPWDFLLIAGEMEPVKAAVEELGIGIPHNKFESHWMARDGSLRLISWSNTALFGKEGLPEYTIATGIDITDHRRTEGTLRESEELYQSLVDALPDIIVLIDLQGNIEMTNHQAALAHGYASASDLKGQNVFDFIVPEERERTMEGMQRALETGTVRNAQYHLIGPNGTPFPVELNASLVLDRTGQPKGFIGIIRDITERKNMEMEIARLDRLNLVGKMAAGIAHEIRNPMTAARGFIQLLREREESKPVKGYYDLITEELDRANSIITEFLSLAKHNLVFLRPHNLGSILESLAPIVQADAATRDMQVETALQPVPDLLLDEREIRQLILNLASNGLDTMASGGVLTLGTHVDDKGQIVLTVQDQGPGMEPEILGKLGTPFFSTKEQGTGLGLAVCFCIAHRHKASVNVKTSPTGSTFLVRFEQQQVKPEPISPTGVLPPPGPDRKPQS